MTKISGYKQNEEKSRWRYGTRLNKSRSMSAPSTVGEPVTRSGDTWQPPPGEIPDSKCSTSARIWVIRAVTSWLLLSLFNFLFFILKICLNRYKLGDTPLRIFYIRDSSVLELRSNSNVLFNFLSKIKRGHALTLLVNNLKYSSRSTIDYRYLTLKGGGKNTV